MKAFEPDKAITVVPGGEGVLVEFLFVLMNSENQVVCNSDVESAAAAGNDIGGVDAFIHSDKVNSADGCAR